MTDHAITEALAQATKNAIALASTEDHRPSSELRMWTHTWFEYQILKRLDDICKILEDH